MRTGLRVGALLLAVACLASVPAAPHEAIVAVEVQVLDGGTLQPIPNAKLFGGLSATTGRDGIARVSLPAAFHGQSFVVGVRAGYRLTTCGGATLIDEDALKKGVLATDLCDPGALTRARVKPVPGRVTIFATPACCVAWSGPPPEIRVLVLSGTTGRPMTRAPVALRYLGGGLRWQAQGMTDAGGAVRVTLGEPIGRVISVNVTLGHDLACSPGLALTERVLKNGFVDQIGPGPCQPNGRLRETPVPGEAVLFARRAPWWRHLLAPWDD